MKDFNELLPIGNVVLLKNGEKRVMIFGVGQTDVADDVEYDYIGVMYPEGNMGDGTQYLFNHSDIDRVDFRGFEDDERDEFIGKLKNYYESARSDNE